MLLSLPIPALLLLVGCLLPVTASPASVPHAAGDEDAAAAYTDDADAATLTTQDAAENDEDYESTVFYEIKVVSSKIEPTAAPEKNVDTTTESSDSSSSTRASSSTWKTPTSGKETPTSGRKTSTTKNLEDDELEEEGDDDGEKTSLKKAPLQASGRSEGTANNDDKDDNAKDKDSRVQDHDCGEYPDVKNGIINRNLSDQETAELRCEPGYRTTAGNLTAEVRCHHGEWKILQHSRPFAPACLPETTSIASVAVCPADPPYLEHGVTELSNETYGELRCLSGYHLEGGAKEVVCVEGQWSLNGKPQCVSDDANPKKRSRMMTTDFKPSASTPPCPHPPTIANAITSMKNDTYGYIRCKPGFMSSRESFQQRHIYFTCDAGVWRFVEVAAKEVVKCVALESPPCDTAALAILLFGTVKRRLTGVTGRCWSGYRFPSGRVSHEYICQDGEWVLPPSERRGCLPHCSESCLNGGVCIAPNLCRCRQNFTGNRCQSFETHPPVRRKTLLPLMRRAHVPLTRKLRQPDENRFTTQADEVVIAVDTISTVAPTTPQPVGTTTSVEDTTVEEDTETTKEVMEPTPVECGTLLPSVNNGTVAMRAGAAQAWCDPGQTFPSGLRRVELLCEAGEWVVPLNKIGGEATCIAEVSCDQPCQNGGMCQPDGNCSCPEGFSGQWCEGQECLQPPVVYNAALVIRGEQATAKCREGFSFSKGEAKLDFSCVEGSWAVAEYGEEAELVCEARCAPPCTNGGKCVEPGQCRCPEDFTGDACELAKCLAPPPYVKNAFMKYDPVVTKAECLPNYVLGEGITTTTTLNISCTDGHWRPEIVGLNVRDDMLECRPVCQEECQNGGRCVAPATCACPAPYDGPHCTDVRRNDCADPPPAVKNAHMNYSSMVGVAECRKGYSLSSGETSIKFACTYGHWSFRHGITLAPECQAVCVGGCQNGGVCEAPNHCRCRDFYSGPLCQTPPSQTCQGPPLPIPNSVIKMSPRGLLVSCRAGYALPFGTTQTELWCQEGAWCPPNSNRDFCSPQERKPQGRSLACFPQCQPPCLNHGECVAPNKCRCQDPYTGNHCELLLADFCWKKPPHFQNAFIQYNSSRAVVTCKPGFTPVTEDTTMTLECVEGEWVGAKDLGRESFCLPSCVPPCANGGTCHDPDTCACAEGYYGPRCERERCHTGPVAVPFSHTHTNHEGSEARVVCFEDYIMYSGRRMVEVECVEGTWKTVGKDPKPVESLSCSPYCREPCLNGGSCAAPNQCSCPANYTGVSCQLLQCQGCPGVDGPVEVTVSNDSLSAVATCKPFHRLETGDQKMTFACREGQWVPQAKVRGQLECRAECPQGCLNGGTCVAPKTCRCQQGFTGSKCHKRYSLTTKNQPCRFPFRYGGAWHHACTDVDSDRPWCATELDARGLITGWGECVADLGENKVVVTAGGQQCILPFSHDGRTWWGCVTTSDRPSPWCAVRVDSAGVLTSWDYCDLDWGVKLVTLTVKADECQLPVRHKGKVYQECVGDTEPSRPWCPTSHSSKGLPGATSVCLVDWGYKRVVVTREKVCIFPFKWQEQLHYSCVASEQQQQQQQQQEQEEEEEKKEGHHQMWCATKTKSDAEVVEWDECINHVNYSETNMEILQSSSGSSSSLPSPHLDSLAVNAIATANGEACYLPFVHDGQRHHGCITNGSERPWCATAVNHLGHVTRRDYCHSAWGPGNQEQLVQTVSGTTCVLPFNFEGRQYHGCIMQGSGRPFCATEVDQTGFPLATDFCHDDWESMEPETSPQQGATILTESGSKCVLPFRYKGKEYSSCTCDDALRSWCATAVDASLQRTVWDFCLEKPEDKDIRMPGDEGQRNATFEKQTEEEGKEEELVKKGKVLLLPWLPDSPKFIWQLKPFSDTLNLKPPVETQLPALQPPEAPQVPLKPIPGVVPPAVPMPVGVPGFELGYNTEEETRGLDDEWSSEDGEVEDVRTADGRKCVFPFFWRGQRYTACTCVEAEREWCATSVDIHGRPTATDFCHPLHGEGYGPPDPSVASVNSMEGHPALEGHPGIVGHPGMEGHPAIEGHPAVMGHPAVSGHGGVEGHPDILGHEEIRGHSSAPGHSGVQGHQAFEGHPSVQGHGAVPGHPAVPGHGGVEGHAGVGGHGAIQGHPAVQGHPGVEGHPAIIGQGPVQGHPAVQGHSPVSGHPAIEGHPGFEGHPAIEGHPSFVGHPAIQGHPNFEGHPAITGHPIIEGHLAIEGHPVLEGHPTIEGHPSLEGHPGIVGHPDVQGHMYDIRHPGIREYQIIGHEGIVGHPDITTRQKLQEAALSCLRNSVNTLYPGSCRAILTVGQEPCVLPFLYEGRWYYECTALTPGAAPVCPTRVDAARNPLAWGVCPPGWYLDYVQPHRVLGSTENYPMLSIQVPLPPLFSHIVSLPESVSRVVTTNGRRCQFPFTYKDQMYSGCTDTDHERPWCVTQHTHDTYEWDNCLAVYVCRSCLTEAYARQYSGNMTSPYTGH